MLDKLFGQRNDETFLKCPECGFECSHIRRAYVRTGSCLKEAEIIRGVEIGEVSDGIRRNTLILCVEGECEHNWNIEFLQHEGTTFVTVDSYLDLSRD